MPYDEGLRLFSSVHDVENEIIRDEENINVHSTKLLIEKQFQCDKEEALKKEKIYGCEGIHGKTIDCKEERQKGIEPVNKDVKL